MRPAILVIGAGGHAQVLVDALLNTGEEVLGLLDANPDRHGTLVLERTVLGGDDRLDGYAPNSVRLVNGIGVRKPSGKRRATFESLVARNFRFAEVTHPSAIIGSEVLRGEGTQVLAGAQIISGARLDDNCIVNTGASVDHDCIVGAHTSIAPGVVLCGDVVVEEDVLIGPGAIIVAGCRLGAGCIVGAGATVLRDVPAGARVFGTPAREA